MTRGHISRHAAGQRVIEGNRRYYGKHGEQAQRRTVEHIAGIGLALPEQQSRDRHKETDEEALPDELQQSLADRLRQRGHFFSPCTRAFSPSRRLRSFSISFRSRGEVFFFSESACRTMARAEPPKTRS